MKAIKDLVNQYPDKQNRGNWLELAKKDSRGVPMPYPVENPVHHVKLVRAEQDTKENFRGIKEEGVMLYFLEDGVEKKYFVPTYVNDKNSDNYGKFHYLFERFADIDEGAELQMEFVRKGKAGYVDVRTANSQVADEEIPVIEANEDGSYTQSFEEQINP